MRCTSSSSSRQEKACLIDCRLFFNVEMCYFFFTRIEVPDWLLILLQCATCLMNHILFSSKRLIENTTTMNTNRANYQSKVLAVGCLCQMPNFILKNSYGCFTVRVDLHSTPRVFASTYIEPTVYKYHTALQATILRYQLIKP